jgi:hypothetical protein
MASVTLQVTLRLSSLDTVLCRNSRQSTGPRKDIAVALTEAGERLTASRASRACQQLETAATSGSTLGRSTGLKLRLTSPCIKQPRPSSPASSVIVTRPLGCPHSNRTYQRKQLRS